MTYRIAQTAFRNISRNKRRSVLSGAAIGVAAMSIVMLFALMGGMSADMSNNLKDFYSGEIRIRNAEYEKYERFNPVHLTVDINAAGDILSDIPFIDKWTPRTTFPTNLYIDGTNFAATGVGVDFQKEASYLDLNSILKDGTMPSKGKNEMLMGAALANNLHLNVGDKVTIMSMTASRGTNAITLEITGLASYPVANLNSNYFWMPLDRTQYFLQTAGASQDILIKTDGSVKPKAASAAIRKAFAGSSINADVQAMDEISTMYSMMKLADAIYNIVAIFFFLLGSTVIINTTMMVIFERMREIGTLSALGMQGSELTRLFLLEGTFISAVGAAAGVIIGIIITLYLGKTGIDFTDAMSGIEMEISSILYPKLSISRTIFVYIYSVAIASLATLIPSRRAAGIQPVDALKYI